MLDRLRIPVVGAPMAGGVSTPQLAAAVSEAGGLGSLAGGYLGADALRERIAELRRSTSAPFAVNLFVPPAGPPPDPQAVAAYAARLAPEAARLGVALGEPRHDDDGWADKLAVVREARVPVVSFTFGCPPAAVVEELRAAGCASWVTVTTAEEGRSAVGAGADALVAQGVEAGAHRGSWDPAAAPGPALLPLLQLLEGAGCPLVAAGGIATGAGVAAAMAAGAAAVQVGTALLRCPEAGTSAVHRAALAERPARPTCVTRAFTGRPARALASRFVAEHDAAAPAAYPAVHHLTAPLRAAAARAGDAGAVHLWAGEAYALAEERPAAEVVARLWQDARRRLAAAGAAR